MTFAHSLFFHLLALTIPLIRADWVMLENYAYENADDEAARKTGGLSYCNPPTFTVNPARPLTYNLKHPITTLTHLHPRTNNYFRRI